MMLLRRLANTASVALLARAERRVPFSSCERIARRQERRVRAIVHHAYETVPFYTDTMRELKLSPRDINTADDLASLPLIDAATMRASPERFLSSIVPASRRRALHSSGTHSGHRGDMWWDERSLLRKLAYLERDRVVIGRLVGRGTGHGQLFLLPTGAQSLVLRDWWNEWTVTPSRLVRRTMIEADVPYEEVADRIDALRPDIVYSYGSYAEHFGRWLAVHGRRLQAPRVWCFGGDGMSSPARALLERQTGSLVHTTYQSTEMGRIGFECERRNGFHLNVDLTALRIADADGRTVPLGTAGDVVTSNLHNRATVLLNYRLGDRGVLATAPCECGRGLPVLQELLGRQTDVMQLRDGREISALVLDALSLEPLAGALRTQIVCGVPGRVTWRAVFVEGADVAAAERALRATIRDRFGDALDASVERVAELPSTPRGKFIRMVHAAAPAAEVRR